MKNALRLEELAMFLLGIFMFDILGYPWWLFLVLFLTPDIGMIGYALGNKLGAASYTIFHHKGIALLLYFVGMYFSLPIVQLVGVVLFSHASFDRIFGFGLKYEKGFKYTHLGEIGNKNG